MAKIVGNSRISHQTITTPGVTFSIPPSEDFTDGTWNTSGTELCLSEIGINETDNKAYVRVGNNINQLAFVGGVNGNNLSQTLAVGNNSGTYSIIMGTATAIKSASTTNEIKLDGYGGVLATTDNGGYAAEVLYMTSGFVQLGSYTTHSTTYINNDKATIGIAGGAIFGISNGILINTQASNYVTPNSTSYPISIGSQNSTLYTSATNSVILGGNGINNATASNSVYVPNLYIQDGRAIKSMNGGGQLNLDLGFAPNTVALSTDNGVLAKSYVYLDNSQLLVAIPNSSIYLSNGIQIASPTASVDISSSSGYVNINNRTFKLASTANSTAATTTLASISMSNNQTLTIQVVLNAYCASPNRNLGITMMASFLKYGGTIYQNGTTNLITKNGFGDGTTATIDTDGTNVRIRITNGAGLITNWNTSYDYLLT